MIFIAGMLVGVLCWIGAGAVWSEQMAFIEYKIDRVLRGKW